MAKLWRKISLEEAQAHPLYGLKGWLLFFVITTFIGWLLGIATVNSAALREGLSLSQLLSLEAPAISYIKFVLLIDLSTLAIVFWFAFSKHAKFRQIVSGVMLITFPLVALIGLSMSLPSEMGNDLAKGFFRWIMSCAVWVTYLQRSVRVRVTFENIVPDGDAIASRHESVAVPVSSRNFTVAPPTHKKLAAIPTPAHIQTHSPTAEPHMHEQPLQLDASLAPTEEDHWAAAMAEIESGTRRPGLWAKAYAESDGDETKAKVAYLKSRVQQLNDSAQEPLREQERLRKDVIAKEQAAVEQSANDEARHIEDTVKRLGWNSYEAKRAGSGWTIREPLGGRVRLASDKDLIEYSVGRLYKE